MRKQNGFNGYDYICTHVDDFKVVAINPTFWCDVFEQCFQLKVVEEPRYYLGSDYAYSKDNKAWKISCSTYVKECIKKLEAHPAVGGKLYGHKTSLPDGIHPEVDESEHLNDEKTHLYQQLLGCAQWANTLCRLDISFACSSLSRFLVNPRSEHLKLAFHLLGYIKKNPNQGILIDSRPLLLDDELTKHTFHPDFLEDYPNASEDIDSSLPEPFGEALQTSVFFDTDWAHDIATRRSIPGFIAMVGSTPLIWQSKRQNCITTSTYCAEFIAMRSAVEESISLRYMLRCLGIPVTEPTKVFGDNWRVIQSASIPESELKKKHIAISYHYVQEAISAKIIDAYWVKSSENFADICTKALDGNSYGFIVNEVMV